MDAGRTHYVSSKGVSELAQLLLGRDLKSERRFSEWSVEASLLADVFDLPHSRIAAIIKEFRTKYSN